MHFFKKKPYQRKGDICFRVSEHSIDRFKQRFKNQIIDGKPVKSLCDSFSKADENKRFKNNIRFMLYVQDRYGYDQRFRFFVYDQIVFVCREETIVTVYNSRDTIFNTQNLTGRFRSKKVNCNQIT